MHIALCSPQWPPSGAANGIVSYVAAVRDHFLSHGHGVSVIARGRLYDESDRSRPVDHPEAPASGALERLGGRLSRRIDGWRGDLPGVGRAVARQIVAARAIAPIDIVEMEESFGWCDRVQRAAGVPVVTRLHGPHFLKPARSRSRRERYLDHQRSEAEGRAIRSARALTAPTRAMLDLTSARYGTASGGTRAVIPNPIAPAPADRRWRIDGCDPDHILMVGRFDFWKGADTMLAAFSRLIERRPGARLTLVGPDTGIEVAPGRVLDYAAYAEAKLPPEARARVTFTGALPPDAIAPLRRSAYVTVLASRCENFPYALLEGLSAGCPMISTDWPGSDEIIRDGETGLLTPVGEADALANRLDRLMGEHALAARLGAGGLEHCRRHFSVDAVGAEMVDYYARTIEAHRR